MALWQPEPVDGRGVVTPEAVVLDLPTATVPSRVTAFALDLVIQGVLLSVVALGTLPLERVAGWLPEVVLAFSVVGVLFAYPAAWESTWRGRTPGKAAVGLRVVTVEGAPVRFRHAALRAMLGLVDFWLPPGGAVAVLSILGSARHQRLGDVVAGTLVLHDRQPVTTAVAPLWHVAAPELEPYVDRLAGAVPPDQLLLIRSFLLRQARYPLAARYAVGQQLVQSVTRSTGVLPPPATRPEDLLAAALAANQQRAT